MSGPSDLSGPLEVVADPEALALRAADWLVEQAERAIEARGRFGVALAGGSTPRAMYRELAWRRLDTRAWHVFFSDERCVPPTDEQSNFVMVQDAWLSRSPAFPPVVYRMRGEDDPEAAARSYEDVLWPVLDVVILGVGEDGHTASLFPRATSLEETERRVLAVIGPKPPPRRLTLSPVVLAQARDLLVLATGAGKAPAVARARAPQTVPSECPARLALRGRWMADAAAAAKCRSLQ